MTAVPAGETDSTGLVCEIREFGFWQALEILDAEFRAVSARELTGGGSPAYYLRQVALESVIADRARIRALISIHRALLGGVLAAEIAHVIGSACEDVARRWRAWADGQRRLDARYPGLGLGQREYDQAAAALDDSLGEIRVRRCACAASAQIGSPHL
jgi:hypothetical protein